MTEVDPLSAAILQLLAEAPPPGGVSLPRIGKRLGLSASALLRHLTAMSDARLAGKPGPGWERVTQTGERWIVLLTDEGRAAANTLAGSVRRSGEQRGEQQGRGLRHGRSNP